MLRYIATRFAKAQYRFRQEKEAATNELHAKLADRLAKEHKDNAARLTKEADLMDARIKEVEEAEIKGYWLCEKGHEIQFTNKNGDAVNQAPGFANFCPECGKPTKLIKRDQMTGQEKYESDKERGEAQDIAKQKRAEAEQEMKSADESDKAAKYFRGIAQNNRTVAEKLRRI